MSIFYLPDLGEGLPEAEIHEWLIKEGEEVKVDQALVSVETAKAIVEVPAPQSGKVIKFHGKPGDIIKTGAPLLEFEDQGTVVGEMPRSDDIVEERSIILNKNRDQNINVKATPAIRILAKKLNVDLSEIKGSGSEGRITKEDIEKASNAPKKLQAGFSEIKGVRRTMAQTMSISHQSIVPVTLMEDADIEAWYKNDDITLRLTQAICKAIKVEPNLNAWFDGANLSRKIHEEVHCAYAVDTEEGLFVPVIKNVDKMDPKDCREEIDTLKKQVLNREIPSEKLSGGTITLSNFGKFAGRYASPIIVPPTVAIVAGGSVRKMPVVHNDKVEIHHCLPVSLTFDHRAVTGGEACRFMHALIEDLKRSG